MPVDKERWLARSKLVGEARRAAVNRLIEKHPKDFQHFYTEECTTRGISMRRKRPAKP